MLMSCSLMLHQLRRPRANGHSLRSRCRLSKRPRTGSASEHSLRDWARAEGHGAKAGLLHAADKDKEGISVDSLERALKGKIKRLEGRCEFAILTAEGRRPKWSPAWMHGFRTQH